MTQKDDARLEQMIRSWSREAQKQPARSECPADEDLAGYASRALNPELAYFVEEHLSDCRTCLEEVILFKRAERAEQEDVPRGIVDRAQSIIPAETDDRGDILDVSILIGETDLALLSTNGQILPPDISAQLRQSRRNNESSLIQVSKGMRGLRIVLEVQRVDTTLCELTVRVRSNVGAELNAARAALMRGARELASFRTQRGVAVFEHVRPGKYDLSISGAGSVARISLTLLETGPHDNP